MKHWPADIQLTQVLRFDSIAWIGSTPTGEQGPENRILEDLRMQQALGGLTVLESRVTSPADLMFELDTLRSRMIARGTRPIIHFYMHGSAEHGLLLAPSGRYCAWSRVVKALRAINEISRHQLLVIFGTCHAYHLAQQADPTRPSFCNMMIAPEKAIDWGTLQDRTAAFYRDALEAENITLAFHRNLKGPMTLFHSEAMLFKALVRYVRENCKGKARRARIEELLSRSFSHHGVENPTVTELRANRRKIKETLRKLDRQLVDRFAAKFLLGQPCGFTNEQVFEFANAS